jgi:hypothetical protein
MIKKITSIIYAIMMIGLIVRLYMDVTDYRPMNGFNFSLFIIFGLIISVIFAEIVFKKTKK